MYKKNVLLASIGILAAVATLIGVALDLQWLRLAAKPLIMLSLMAWIYPSHGGYSKWIMVGLGFSIAGGLLLELEGMFLFGLIAFLFAHLAYIGAYLMSTRRLSLGRALPFFLYGIAVYIFLWPGLGELAAPVAIYILAICTMMWRAAVCVGAHGQPAMAEWVALTGAILFALSDTLIGVYVFRSPSHVLNYPILVLYWAGQFGIAYSAKRSRLLPD